MRFQLGGSGNQVSALHFPALATLATRTLATPAAPAAPAALAAAPAAPAGLLTLNRLRHHRVLLITPKEGVIYNILPF